MIMGGVELHQELKNLCANANWKYAVFWKLNHQDQTTLNCEDAYCDNLRDGCISNDLLGLEVLKMSYNVYSIGEGMIGRVAASGKHLWKSGQQLANGSLDEHLDGWRTQFKAGIRTVVGIAFAPYGVVQLGSLNNITEDLKLVNRIREIFFNLQQCSLISSTDCSPCVTDLPTSSSSGRFHNHINNKDKTMKKNMSNTCTILETINNHQENQDPISDFTHNDQNQNLFIPKTSNHQIPNNPNESLKFPIGCELYEALGPALCKQKHSFEWDPVTTTETLTVNEMHKETSGSILSNSEHLLEAVVAKGGSVVHPSASDLLTGGSVCNSFDMTTNFEACGRVEGSREPPAMVGKKRARAGQSGRPRPGDRQLIQDRIKELRQLVPNGSKCSIDSLLEQTIKHMLFMQSVTKHTDKCDEFKLLGKEKGVQGRPRGHEQGSSWAMEVGNGLKLCPIIVENIGVNGQMLIEMMCDECVQFLEITEAIRSLGLTILKGVTDVSGDKTWMCFVVEEENNRNIHRVDILLSLIHILELKANT